MGGRFIVAGLTGVLAAATALAGDPVLPPNPTDEQLATAAQNPVSDLISVPFQDIIAFGVGPQREVANILNIQPVYPIEVNKDWNVITRTIIPLIWQPGFASGEGTQFGLGDVQLSAFLSPSTPGGDGLIWGAGAIVQMPTDTDARLGNKNWGLGPTAVVLRIKPGDPWVVGVLVNNLWSLSSDKRGGAYNNGLMQPFLNYNFPGGLYLTTAPIITVNWKADSGQQWTVPLGGGVGKIFHLGKLPVNTQVGAYYNVVHPDDGATWQLRAQVQLMFPK
jgi:hypothetical protein